jgi:hypothetical protein
VSSELLSLGSFCLSSAESVRRVVAVCFLSFACHLGCSCCMFWVHALRASRIPQCRRHSWLSVRVHGTMCLCLLCGCGRDTPSYILHRSHVTAASHHTHLGQTFQGASSTFRFLSLELEMVFEQKWPGPHSTPSPPNKNTASQTHVYHQHNQTCSFEFNSSF